MAKKNNSNVKDSYWVIWRHDGGKHDKWEITTRAKTVNDALIKFYGLSSGLKFGGMQLLSPEGELVREKIVVK